MLNCGKPSDIKNNCKASKKNANKNDTNNIVTQEV